MGKSSRVRYEYFMTDELLAQVKEWLDKGLNDMQIAENLRISRATLCRWKRVKPEFKELFEKGHETQNLHVENAFYKSCIGYTIKETKILANGDTIETIKEVGPNGTSCWKWLTQRSPRWRQIMNVRVVNDSTGEDNPLSGLSDKELKKLISNAVKGTD